MTDQGKDLAQRRQTLLEEQRHVTGKVSDLCRFIGFALLAVFYAIQIGDADFAERVRENRTILLYGIGFSGALAILFDYLQFLCGARSVKEALDRTSQDYNKDSWFYRGRKGAYRGKQWATGVGAVLLVLLVAS